MMSGNDDDELMRAVALRNASSILAARRRAEEALERVNEALEARSSELAHSLAMMTATLEATTDAILVTDADRRVTASNRRYANLWDLDPALVDAGDHDPILAVVARRFADPTAFLARIEAIYAGGEAEEFDELVLADGRVIERYSRVQRVGPDNVGRVWTFREITLRRRAEEALREQARRRTALVDAERAARSEAERMSRLKDEFLATLSHELRTPLTAILGWSNVLQSKGDDAAQVRRGLQAIERNARAQARLIEDLLDMNRIVSGKLRLDAAPTELAPVIAAAVEAVRPSALAKSMHVEQNLARGVPAVLGDAARLQQVVWNLLANAIKFTPAGGTVSVALRAEGHEVAVAVRDSGAGIEPSFLPHVFDRFRQADASTTRRHGGLGLGLSIVKQLVELHGGKVQAESAGAGQGATFTVRLPAAEQPHARASGAAHAPGPIAPVAFGALRLDGVKVLVLDDEADARELIGHVLRECGAEVASAGSANEALALLDATRPDVVVSDVGMPDTDGYEFVHRLRSLSPAHGGATPAVAVTAFARAEDRSRALDAGFQVHLSKPIEPHQLVATVVSLAQRH